MTSPTNEHEFLDLLQRSGLVPGDLLAALLEQVKTQRALPGEPAKLAQILVDEGLLTYFQAEQLLQGKWRGFSVGKYQLLERLGAGGMGIVYLCEHKILHRKVAVKILPTSLAKDPTFLELFYREAQAIAALDHPHIVHAHDVDSDGNLHFLVMEYVDGASLQEVVEKHGPLDQKTAAHYLRQGALGLQHAHERGLVHRDIKPANLLVDRQGIVKILDLGLAHFFKGKPGETSGKRSKMIVGTDDYLAPEQIVNSDEADARADIYGLGATCYFLLTAKPPFDEVETGYQKLLRHLAKTPTPLRQRRPEVSAPLAALIEKMMAKNPWDRFQNAAELVEALAPWTQGPPPPPPVLDLRRLSPAARLSGVIDPSRAATNVKKNSWVLSGVRRENASSLTPPPRSSDTQVNSPGSSAVPPASKKPGSPPQQGKK